MSIHYRGFLLAFTTAVALSSVSANADVIIDNDIAAGTLGHYSVTVRDGGESRSADLTASRTASADIFTEDLLFDYFSYFDIGSGGVQLSGSAPVLSGNDEATSSGSFTGSGGNSVDWTVVSSIDDGGSVFENLFTFSVTAGSIGTLDFIQYLDEDIESVSDDVFFTRGSVAGGDLELFTLDNTEEYGVSHSGALTAAQGLISATFDGWAACTFNSMKPAITGGTQAFSLSGDVCASLPAFNHATFGAAFGPRDIVSSMRWTVDPNATTATIITTLGGLADIVDLPPANDIPEPGTLAIFGLGLLGMGMSRRRRRVAA